MANVIITLRIMPESPSSNLKEIESKSKELIENLGGYFGKSEIEPIAFGLKSVNIIFSWPEANGDTDPLEQKIKEIKEVESAEVISVTRSL